MQPSILKRICQIDVIISFLLIALAAWVYWYAGFLITENSQPISSHTFPRTLAILLACCSLVLLTVSFTQPDEQSSGSSHKISGLSPNLFVILILITLIIYAVLLPITGFIIASLLIFAFWLWLLGIRYYGILAGYTIGVITFVYVLFQTILNVPLP